MKIPNHSTIRARCVPPLRDFTAQSLSDLSRRVGGQVRIKYNPKHREFLLFVPVGTKQAQDNLAAVLQAFPEQTIRL